jgi:hypothetical protein
MPTGMNALPVLKQTDRVLPCRCQLDTFLLYPHGHEMPFAYERPLCAASSGRSRGVRFFGPEANAEHHCSQRHLASVI